MDIRPVDDELLHEVDVVLGHLLRVGEDLGHQHRHPHLHM